MGMGKIREEKRFKNEMHGVVWRDAETVFTGISLSKIDYNNISGSSNSLHIQCSRRPISFICIVLSAQALALHSMERLSFCRCSLLPSAFLNSSAGRGTFVLH